MTTEGHFDFYFWLLNSDMMLELKDREQGELPLLTVGFQVPTNSVPVQIKCFASVEMTLETVQPIDDPVKDPYQIQLLLLISKVRCVLQHPVSSSAGFFGTEVTASV